MGCAVLDIHHFLGKKWTILILQELDYKPMSNFNNLSKRIVGITNRVLSYRLRFMEHQGLITKEAIILDPLRVHYTITEKGRGLMRVVDSMKNWCSMHKLVDYDCVKTNCNSCSMLKN